MILQFVVLIGFAIYFAINQQWFFCVWSLACLIPRYGLNLAIALAVILILSNNYTAGILLALLIAFNLIGNELVKRKRRSSYVGEPDVTINFIRYCKEYLIVMRSLDEEDAALAVLDPYLGEIMDEVKRNWAFHTLREYGIEDPDEYLLNFRFNSPKMENINNALDDYSKIFKDRKPEIIEYLNSLDTP